MRKRVRLHNDLTGVTVAYEECTPVEWDRESEVTREFIDFGGGYTCARLVKEENRVERT